MLAREFYEPKLLQLHVKYFKIDQNIINNYSVRFRFDPICYVGASF